MVLNVAQEVWIDDSFYRKLGIKRIWKRAVDAPSYDIATLLRECVRVVALAKEAVSTTTSTTPTTTLTHEGKVVESQREKEGGREAEEEEEEDESEGESEEEEEEEGEGVGRGPILVHCAAGVSRSVTVVLAALMHLEGMALKDAFLMVKARRSIVYPNRGFLSTLMEVEKELFGCHSIPPAALQLHEAAL